MDIDFEFWLTLIVVIMGAILLLHWMRKIYLNITQKNIVRQRDQKDDESFFVRTSKEYFGVLLFVLVLRSFMFEPNLIPTGSMLPTLTEGDFILVKKYAYGLRLPVVGTKILEVDEPKRGDIAVFNSLESTPRLFIKRIIGLPGDTVSFRNEHWYINGEQLSKELSTSENSKLISSRPAGVTTFVEGIDGFNHYIWDAKGSSVMYRKAIWDNKYVTPFVSLPGNGIAKDHWQVTVPEGHYFAMGDNRENSTDSRVWGFVPDANLKGKAFYLWMHKVPGKWYDFNLTFERNKRLDESL